jgi:hypothetical protein
VRRLSDRLARRFQDTICYPQMKIGCPSAPKFTDVLTVQRSVDCIRSYLNQNSAPRMTVIDFAEARKTKRRRVLDPGLIRFGDISICCVARDMSEAGAALDIGTQIGIPDQFTLIVVPKKKIYSCTVVWRKERRIGVAFY